MYASTTNTFPASGEETLIKKSDEKADLKKFAKTKVFNVEELLDFFEKEKEKMLAELQTICDRDENEGGRLLLEEYKESK